MIDFKQIYHINCRKIQSNGKIVTEMVKCKVLQLTVERRADLRHKLSKYFERIPEEDKILLE